MGRGNEEPLEKTLDRVAKTQGLDKQRLRRWISFLAVCGVLERAVEAGTIDGYYLKGGVALELRFAASARATKDLDIGMPGQSKERQAEFRKAIAVGFDDFTFEVKGRPITMEKIDTVRLELGVRYKTRGWQTVDVDLGPAGESIAEMVQPAILGIPEIGLAEPRPVRCLNISEQVAQKLHACTGPYREGRARDILDILLIDLMRLFNPEEVCAASEKIFKERATHAFPPPIHVPMEWQQELKVLANELGYDTDDADEIESRFRKLVESLRSG